MESDIAVVEPQQGLMIFGTQSPLGIITKATAIADALAPLIEKKKLYKVIGSKKHVYVEGWNTMLAMLGVFPSVEYSRKIGEAPTSYESRVVLKHVSGVVVGAGEALCTSDESNWNAKDEFQLKSMSQTRATGKAARLSFSWIMGLAGYEATPAEEVTEAGAEQKADPIPGPKAKTEDAPQGDTISESQAKRFFAIAKGAGKSNDEINDYCGVKLGITRSSQMLKKDYEAACKWAEGKA